MSLITHKLAAATAVAAAVSLAAVPAAAAELPRVAGQARPWDAHALDAGRHGHGGRYGRYGHHDNWHIDGGDVLTGVLILGGLAAIAGIAGAGTHHDEVYRDPEPYPEPEADYVPPARDDRYRSGGMAEAVDTCVAEVESGRGAVSSVDRASRSGEGWYVAGELDSGSPYTCWIDGDGRVTDIEAGDDSASNVAPGDDAEDDGSVATLQKQGIDSAAGDDGQYEVAEAGDLAN